MSKGKSLPQLFKSRSMFVPQEVGCHTIGDVSDNNKVHYVLELQGITPHGSDLKDVFLIFSTEKAVREFASAILEQLEHKAKENDSDTPASDTDTNGQPGASKAE